MELERLLGCLEKHMEFSIFGISRRRAALKGRIPEGLLSQRRE
jgi:hypothetical protein